jgi:hypothetical protein
LKLHVRPSLGKLKVADSTWQNVLRLHHKIRSPPVGGDFLRVADKPRFPKIVALHDDGVAQDGMAVYKPAAGQQIR